MPSLDWIGKSAVLNHHTEVPYRLLHCNGSLSAGDKDSGNLLVQGDNLEALKALLPHYVGQVKCIYIAPPYNTGNESWVYNDNVNSPEMRRWLGKVVGKESEDLSRHDKWLCMMYPRLRLLREFLREDGVIFVSIDDNEQAQLKLLMDEIFGEKNFLAMLTRRCMHTVRNPSQDFNKNSDYIFSYVKDNSHYSKKDVEKIREKVDKSENYKLNDNDGRGFYKLDPIYARNYAKPYKYIFQNGFTWEAKNGSYPRYSEESLKLMEAEGRINLEGREPRAKRYLNEVQVGQPPDTFLKEEKVGFNSDGTKDLAEVLGNDKIFSQPKPIKLIDWLIRLLPYDGNDIILDSFAGSGTTGHAVLAANAADGGNRRFILVEMDKTIAKDVTAQRLRRVVEGDDKGGEAAKPVAGLGGGFRFCRLGAALFDELGEIVGEVSFADLAAHVFFIETGAPLPKRVPEGGGPLIGVFGEKAVYLLYSASAQGVPVEAENNVLTPQALRWLGLPESGDRAASPAHVVYAEGCALSAEQLATERIVFRQIPYHLTQVGGATNG